MTGRMVASTGVGMPIARGFFVMMRIAAHSPSEIKRQMARVMRINHRIVPSAEASLSAGCCVVVILATYSAQSLCSNIQSLPGREDHKGQS